MDLEVVKRFERFQVSETEGGNVELSMTDIRFSSEVCEKSLVGRIFGDISVNFTGLRQTMKNYDVGRVASRWLSSRTGCISSYFQTRRSGLGCLKNVHGPSIIRCWSFCHRQRILRWMKSNSILHKYGCKCGRFRPNGCLQRLSEK